MFIGERTPAALNAGVRLGVVGAGAIGKALLRGLLDSGVEPGLLWAATRSAASSAEVESEFGIVSRDAYADFVPASDIVVLCVKPAQVPHAVARLCEAGMRPETLVISVAAGFKIARIEALLHDANPVVRAMPNTPCLVGQGMTAIASGTRAGSEHIAAAERIFSAVGRCIRIDEAHLNAVTALSGSGPAYIYLVIEALSDAGVRIGLPRDVAMELVAQTVLGAARMVQESPRHPAALRDDVTTPAGCTIGALLVLEDGKIRSVLARAVEEATRVLEGVERKAEAAT